MTFPGHKFDTIAPFLDGYLGEMRSAAERIDRDAVARAAARIDQAIEHGAWIFVCGNGGSAAIANHLTCDFVKGIQTNTGRRPRVQSLSSNIELITAIGNDLAYADIFAYQLSTLARSGDLLLTVSSSGNSENIVRAVQWAKEHGMATIALTGFDGGRSAQLAEIGIHVPAANYGIVEDLHQSIMHVLAQYIRQKSMPFSDIASCKF
jgi:D-sedoheptulose 7-phosphate isomerase